jgi:hypothetical protein
MFILKSYMETHYATIDNVYRIIANPDPWERDGRPLPDTWLVKRATYDDGHHETICEVGTLRQARERITHDMAGSVFVPDLLGNSGRLSCRWCDCFPEDVIDRAVTRAGCRLCISELEIMGVMASC